MTMWHAVSRLRPTKPIVTGLAMLLAAALPANAEEPAPALAADLVDGKPYGHFFSLRGGMPSALV